MGAIEPTPVAIDQDIVGWELADKSAANTPDADPRFLRVGRREEGCWEARTMKLVFPGSAGQRQIYLSFSLGVVCGTRAGRQICIERPLEFFVQALASAGGDRTVDALVQQLVSSNMRMLSLAARGGFLSKALEDMRQVEGSESIWYGKTPSGKTIVHGSTVALISWAFQQELRKIGYFNERNEEADIDVLVAAFEQKKAYWSRSNVEAPLPVLTMAVQNAEPAPFVRGPGRCPEQGCDGRMEYRDGCPTCQECGYSKCS